MTLFKNTAFEQLPCSSEDMAIDLTTRANILGGLVPKKQHFLKNEDDKVKTRLLESITYISHPSLSSLECSINLKHLSPLFLTPDQLLREPQEELKKINNYTFNLIANKVLSMESFNPTQVIKNYKCYSLKFKDVAAIKFLKMVFKGHTNHALYQLYIKWVSGSEWMLNY